MSSPRTKTKTRKNVSFSNNRYVRSFSPVNHTIKNDLFYNNSDYDRFNIERRKERAEKLLKTKPKPEPAQNINIIFTNDEEDDGTIKFPKGYVKKSRYGSGGKRRTYKKRRN
jgi:hypothetical protein